MEIGRMENLFIGLPNRHKTMIILMFGVIAGTECFLFLKVL